jgi:hypothetical protein
VFGPKVACSITRFFALGWQNPDYVMQPEEFAGYDRPTVYLAYKKDTLETFMGMAMFSIV